jgi:hypothetical protein
MDATEYYELVNFHTSEGDDKYPADITKEERSNFRRKAFRFVLGGANKRTLFYVLKPKGAAPAYLRVILQHEKQEILESCHEMAGGGHKGTKQM